MKKKIILGSVILFLIVSISFIVFQDRKLINSNLEENVKYAITVDGTVSEDFPAYGDYDVSITCDNANAIWDYGINGIKFNNISGPSSCNVSFTTRIAGITLSNYIIDDVYAGTEGNNGVYKTNNHEYRYTGKFPNNYVWHNDEYWRIIGVFDSNSHGRSGENLVKIIRDDSLPSLVWDTENDNSWADADGGASLNKILNNYYYNGTNGSSDAGCRSYSTTIAADCDYTVSGLDTEARNMVQSVTWFLGGYNTELASAVTMYGYERGNTVSSGSEATTNANIGLMYASDYGYASEYSCWSANTNLSSYDTATCTGTNWLFKNDYEWTISASSSNSFDVWRVFYNGYVNYNIASIGYSVRPVLYLNSSVERVSGTGTKVDPYIIK